MQIQQHEKKAFFLKANFLRIFKFTSERNGINEPNIFQT